MGQLLLLFSINFKIAEVAKPLKCHRIFHKTAQTFSGNKQREIGDSLFFFFSNLERGMEQIKDIMFKLNKYCTYVEEFLEI